MVPDLWFVIVSGSTSSVEHITPRLRNQPDTLVVLESHIVNDVQPKKTMTGDVDISNDVRLNIETKDTYCRCNELLKRNQKSSERNIPKMFPPGKIIHLVSGQNRKTWHLKYVNDRQMSEIKVSECMATDHFPQEYINGLTYITSHLMNNTLVHI